MASFTGSNSSNSNSNMSDSINLVASTFVRQYYTLLNKAPGLIHNFYSPHSTFIYGTIEMSDDHTAKPVVGRDNIKQRMQDLKLHDCRAKIKRIDCLKTLADGLVIQVIGEMSNNGKAMRRFSQTFVLAPSPESRQDGDAQHRQGSDRRGPNQPSDSVNVTPKSVYFVLNSIFRYQVDGVDSESDLDTNSVNTSVSNTNEQATSKSNRAQDTRSDSDQNDSTSIVQGRRRFNADNSAARKSEADIERLSEELDVGLKMDKQQLVPEDTSKRDIETVKVDSNGAGESQDIKAEVSEKSTENGKSATERSLVSMTSNSASTLKAQTSIGTTAPKPQTPAEPKTWANMVRNTPSSTTQANAPKLESHPVANQNTSVHPHQHNYQSHTQTHLQQQQQQQQQQQPPQQQSPQQQHQSQQPHHNQLQNQQPQAQQQNPPTQQPQSSHTQSTAPHTHQSQNMNVNRRRHILRKGPANKTTGRPLNKSNRPRLGPSPMVSMPHATASISVTGSMTIGATPTTTSTNINPQPPATGGRPYV